MHEQATIAGEESAAFGDGDIQQLSIFRVAIINNIDPKEAQVANQFSQMSISDKHYYIAYLQSIFREKSNSIRINRVNIDVCRAGDYPRKIDRLPVDQNQIDFGVGNPASLNRVFDRSLLGKLAINGGGFRGQKKRQVAVEP